MCTKSKSCFYKTKEHCLELWDEYIVSDTNRVVNIVYYCRKLKVSKTASKISECIPSFCTAYIISKGKLSFVHSATSDTCETLKSISSSTVSSPSSRSLSSSAHSGNTQVCKKQVCLLKFVSLCNYQLIQSNLSSRNNFN